MSLEEMFEEMAKTYESYYPKEKICIGKMAQVFIGWKRSVLKDFPKPSIYYLGDDLKETKKPAAYSYHEVQDWLQDVFGVVIEQ